MNEAITSNETRPVLKLETSRAITSHVQKKEDVVCAQAQFCWTLPTDQVPQPVPRDTTMAAEKSNSRYLTQSAPSVQAQVSSTGCVYSCDDVTLQHNHCGPLGGGAGPHREPHALLSVIPSSSCCPVVSTRPFSRVADLAIHNNDLDLSSESFLTLPSGGNSNIKSTNKMQSVNVNCSLAANNVSINNKGNDWKETGVTVPNIEPQRNTERCTTAEPNNNSVKSLELVNVNNHGALILFPSDSNRQIPDNDIPVVLLPTVQGKKYSNYYPPKSSFKQTTDTEYASLYTESESKSGIVEGNTRDRMTYCGPLRLRGGGESSLNTGSTGWGTPPAANNNNGNSSKSNNQNPNQQQNQNQTPATQPGNNQSWNQPGSGGKQAGNGPNGQSVGPNGNPAVNQASGQPTNNSSSSAKQQLEQLNSMREALYSQDGWGGQHVNQDTNWDIPSSPEPGQKEGPGGAPLWKPPVNNGTELWEANLRNGGQPPPQPVQKTPWGHTPTTNIGGTWGEDDDTTDSSNVWTGVPNPPQWGGATTGNGAGGGMWGAGPKKEEWGGNTGATVAGSGWGDPRADPRTATTNIDPREAMRSGTASLDPRGTAATAVVDPRESMRMLSDPMRETVRDPRLTLTDMRGDPRGITGRLANDAMWGAGPPPPHHMGHHQPPTKMGPAPNGVNQWVGPPTKEMPGMGNKPSGWEEPSPPSQRRNMPNFDDGTSFWGNPNQQQTRMGSSTKLSHWTDMPTGGPMGSGRGGGVGAGGGTCPSSMVGRKPADAPLWGRNGSWTGEDTPQHWGDDAWGKPKAPIAGAWEQDIEWHKSSAGPKSITKEMVWGSKQFRTLVEYGFKKEDAENALRLRDMNLDEAYELLKPGIDAWRGGSASQGRHDDHTSYDHATGTGPYGAQRFGPGSSQPMPFPQSPNAPNLMNNMGSSNNNLTSLTNMSPNVMQKMLGSGNAGGGVGTSQLLYAAGGQGRVVQPQQPPQSQPSAQQLRMLVQQIQLAVQQGYLNHQILNQPLAPQTLLLLNQLLQNIKMLQTLGQQQNMFQAQGSLGANKNAQLQLSVQITKTKQQIANLQNQIAVNQASFVKTQMGGSGAGPDFLKTNLSDPMATLQTNFGDLTINKEPQTAYVNQQSRLNQWMKPDKEELTGADFSRAPGPVAKPPAPHASPSMNLGLGQSDGPWSTGRSADTGGWPNSGGEGPDTGNKDAWPSAQQSTAYTDLVPEFEPGKPWKGNQIKSIEDDPSITPGSVVRSPLSIATIKDPDVFSAAPTQQSKVSPPGADLQPLSLSSSTWSFNPPASTTSAFTSPLSKLGSSKGTWSDAPPQATTVTSELWGAPTGKSRGPPPGLAKGAVATANGWGAGIAGTRSSGGASWSAPNWGGGSSWLLLRNLTAQIDGSTLQTLCKQHGPLLNFHLHLNHGFALAKYSSHDEAIKAQTALNNCVLGNTTILAEAPADTEVTTLLQNLAQQSGSGSAAWRGAGGKAGSVSAGTPDAWGTACWPPTASASASLWGVPPSAMDSDAQRSTPSSLNSYLPGDLLGGESM